MQQATVYKLDRGFPLVKLADGQDIRCEYSASLSKRRNKQEGPLEGADNRVAVGDEVLVSIDNDHDKGIICEIMPRKSAFVRKDPTEKTASQVLAANFDRVILAQPLGELNIRRLERELVLACKTGAQVSVALTKADLAENPEQIANVHSLACAICGSDIEVVVVSQEDPKSIEELRALIPEGSMSILVGKSGVGKSSLINMLLGEERQSTSSVRARDGKGRHTTVSREIIKVPRGGYAVDMPGIRGLGLWDAKAGIETVFSDIEELAAQCRFRNCSHTSEPGCAVLRAIEEGRLRKERFASYQNLQQEVQQLEESRELARRLNRGKSKRRKPEVSL